jgi:hypothetical protein
MYKRDRSITLGLQVISVHSIVSDTPSSSLQDLAGARNGFYPSFIWHLASRNISMMVTHLDDLPKLRCSKLTNLHQQVPL